MSVWRIALREVMSVLNNRTLRTIVLLGQAFYMTVFGFVYVQGRVQNVPFTVIDNDNSAISRALVQDMDVTDGLRYAYTVNSMAQYEQLNRDGKSFCCVVIPTHMARDLKSGRAPAVMLTLDGSNVIMGNVVYKAALGVLSSYRVQARILKLMATGSTKSQAAGQALPISVETRSMWLSSFNYSAFMLFGLACIAMQQVCMLGASMVMGLEFEERQRRKSLAGRSWLQVMWGKLLGQCMLLVPLSVISMSMPIWFFKMPVRGSFAAILGLMVLYLVIHILCGIGLGAMTRNAILSAQMLLTLSAPLFTLTGFTWPLMAMPDWLHKAVLIMPLTHYADAVRKIALVGCDAAVIGSTVLVLLAWLVIALIWASWGCRRLQLDNKGCN